MASELVGIIETLRNGERPSDATIDELERILNLLRDEGWSGFITADAALNTILRNFRG